MSRCYVWAEHNPEFLPDAIAYAMDEDGAVLGGSLGATPDEATRNMRCRLLKRGCFDGDIEIVPSPVYDHDGWLRAALRARRAPVESLAASVRRADERASVGWKS